VMIDRLFDIQKRHPIIGDVRGMGLAQGIELVRDPKTKEPAAAETTALVEESIRHGLALIPPIGFHNNVIRFAPPLTITETMAHRGLDLFESALKAFK
jgi:4-aminobutyrate aminotransferase-like enzyme